jgi:hypothetical protein
MSASLPWQNTTSNLQQLDCSYVGQELFKEIGGRIGFFSWALFLAATWLLISYRLKTRFDKGKSHLHSLRGEAWFDYTSQYVYIFMFMASLWLVVYGGFGI